MADAKQPVMSAVPRERILRSLDGLEYDPDKDMLGAGAFGTVFRAKLNGYEVAAKVVDRAKLRSLGMNVQSIDGFVEEAKVMSALSHPLLIMMIAFYVDEDRYIIIQELANGGSLDHALRKNSAMCDSNEKKLRITLQIIQGLRYLHHHKFIHRDLKAENVLLDSHGKAMLGDFGLSKLLSHDDDDVILHSARGTPWWRAPEMATESGYTQKADVFSLGMTITELFTKSMKEESADGSEAMMYNGITNIQQNRVTTSVSRW